MNTGRSVVVEGRRGAARRAYVGALLDQARSEGAEAHWVTSRLDLGGPWAGLADLLRVLLPRIDAKAPQLVKKHSYELAMALPELRRRFPFSDGSLTDASPAKERVRSYPVDRAYRLVHGLIDLLDAWLPQLDRRLVVACDYFDGTGALMRRFFRELSRRRLSRLPLDLIFVVDAGKGLTTVGELGDGAATIIRPDLPAADAPAVDAAELARTADRLEARLEKSLRDAEADLPQLIYCCLQSGQIERAQRWRTTALAIYNHFGLYEDALFFGEPLLDGLDRTCEISGFSRWLIVSGLFNALVAIGQPERAYQVVHDEGLQKISDPKDRISIYYTLAMLHCRFLPQRDLHQAEAFLGKSLEAIEHAGLQESEKHYLIVFSLNGLAFIRHLQGRVAEALELCRAGFERLNAHLGDEQYRLHRSVLLYNIAQVHTSTRTFDDAVAHYTAAMEIDPRYSEYYNERGNVFLKMGRLGEAVADYQRAIELSAPYHEVWTNLGQAYKLMEDAMKAVAAYSTALDLAPRQLLPLLGRAQAYELLGCRDEALADYTAALEIDDSDAHAWSNRAVVQYELGRPVAAVSDLNHAISRAPADPQLYFNRAVALDTIGRRADADRDRATYHGLVKPGGAPLAPAAS